MNVRQSNKTMAITPECFPVATQQNPKVIPAAALQKGACALAEYLTVLCDEIAGKLFQFDHFHLTPPTKHCPVQP